MHTHTYTHQPSPRLPTVTVSEVVTGTGCVATEEGNEAIKAKQIRNGCDRRGVGAFPSDTDEQTKTNQVEHLGHGGWR